MKLIDHPTLAAEWHPTKNGDLTPENVNSSSREKGWWQCSKGHEWLQRIEFRTLRHNTCAICKINAISLAVTHPHLAEEFHPTLNGDLTAETVTYGRSTKAWWLGKDCQHVWDATPANRARLKQNCPYCAGKRVIPGKTDIATTHPELLIEWHPTLNTLKPTEISKGSHKKVWWLGKDCQHAYEATIPHRLEGKNCPYCAGRRILAKDNDLLHVNPKLGLEFHPTFNGAVKADELAPNARASYWWLCSACSHEWKAAVYSRSAGNGCPKCGISNFQSEPEKYIVNFLNKLDIKTEQSNRTLLDGQEIDIYLPDFNFAIEYNGLYWHSEQMGKNKYYHRNKYELAQQKGIQLIQIWEDDWKVKKDFILISLLHKLNKHEYLEKAIPGLPSANYEKIDARKSTISAITYAEALAFLNTNHIQGGVTASIYLGLKDKKTNTLRAVLTFKKEKDNYILNRYATIGVIRGGFTKMLSYFEKTYKPTTVITFADHTVSNGKLYENNDFIAEKELLPDYSYLYRSKREHKFNFRLKRFKTDASLVYVQNKSESELAIINNIYRIWDAGKTRYVKRYNYSS